MKRSNPEYKELMRQHALKHWADPEQRERQRNLMTGDENPTKRPEVREKLHKALMGNKNAKKK